MNVCQDGYNRLPAIKARAPGDIRHRLETLYWHRLVVRGNADSISWEWAPPAPGR